METLPTCVARRGNSMQLMQNFFPLRVTLLLVDSASHVLFVGVLRFAFPGLFDDDPVMVSSFMEMCCERMHDMTGRWCVCLFHLMHQFQRVLYRKIVFFQVCQVNGQRVSRPLCHELTPTFSRLAMKDNTHGSAE